MNMNSERVWSLMIVVEERKLQCTYQLSTCRRAPQLCMYYDSFCKTYLRFMTTQERVIMTEVMVLITS